LPPAKNGPFLKNLQPMVELEICCGKAASKNALVKCEVEIFTKKRPNGLVDLKITTPPFTNGKQLYRWWFQTFLYVHPYLGKILNLTNIFKMG